MRRGVLILVLAGVATAAMPSAAHALDCGTTLDDFNRANSTDLGAGWTEHAAGASMQVLDQEAHTDTSGTFPSANATRTSESGETACATISQAPPIHFIGYAGFVFRRVDNNNAAVIQLADTSGNDSAFDMILVYPNLVIGQPVASVAITPVSSARVRVSLSGGFGQVQIDSNLDTVADQTVNLTSIPTPAGTGTGIVVTTTLAGTNPTFVPPALDDYSITSASLDTDGDGIADDADNCRTTANSGQADTDTDGLGDACDPTPNGDADNDGVDDLADNCPSDTNPGQEDSDADSLGDACDPTPNGDTDSDGIDELADNCPANANPGQEDLDGDSVGDACDPDIDGDAVANAPDLCPTSKPTADANGDGCTDASTALVSSPVFKGLGKARKGRRAKKRYVFTFQDSLPGVTFRCSLDGAPFEPCASPAVYRGLRPGLHTFSVKSIDANGTEATPQSTSFRIKKPRRR